MRDESELEASYSLICFVRIFLMFCDSQTRKYPLFVIRITGALYVVCTQTSYRATLRLHSFTPTVCLSWFHLTMKSGGTETYTWKWLGLRWIQVLWLAGGGSGGAVLVHVWTGGEVSGRASSSHAVWDHLQAQEEHLTIRAVFAAQTAALHLLDQENKKPQAGWKHPTGWAVMCCVTWHR